jgi:hypothetical protein
MAPGELPPELEAELDSIAGSGQLGDLPSRSDADLQTMTEQLEAFEQRISGDRQALFERIDALQAEITRRYKDGEASVDALLT